MFRHVLLCYDGSRTGQQALRRGADLAILVRARVSVLSVVPDAVARAALIAGATGYACVVESATEQRVTLDQSLAALKERGIDAQGFMGSGDIAEQIVHHARRLSVDLVVLGHYPQPQGGFWWGKAQTRASLTERVGCCVLVAVSGEGDGTSVP